MHIEDRYHGAVLRNDDKLKADYRNEFNEEPPKSLTNGYSYVDFTIPFPKLLLSKDNFNMLVEGYHFNITASGRIVFKNVSW